MEKSDPLGNATHGHNRILLSRVCRALGKIPSFTAPMSMKSNQQLIGLDSSPRVVKPEFASRHQGYSRVISPIDFMLIAQQSCGSEV